MKKYMNVSGMALPIEFLVNHQKDSMTLMPGASFECDSLVSENPGLSLVSDSSKQVNPAPTPDDASPADSDSENSSDK